MRFRRTPIRVRGLHCLGLIAVGLLGGCASQFVGIPGSDTTQQPATGNVSAQNSPADTPQAVSDLWSRIRSGLQLGGDNNRVEVRELVQFFASHQRHLHDSADRAQPYLRHIVDNVEARDMPMEIALLPLVESSFDPFAGGGERASGLWQFMPITAKRFGLNNNDWYEGRRDVLLSTRAALDYLEFLHARFGDWLLALAAYNAGEGTVGRAIEAAAAQYRPTDFWHLDLPAETERYIPKLLALGELVAKPRRFGLTWPSMPDAPAFVAVEMPALTSLSTAAGMMGVPEKRLRALNPALRGNTTRPDGPHVLLVPADHAERFQAELAKVADPRRLRWLRHEVKAGESLSKIADDYDVEEAKLKQSNDLAGVNLVPGQHLWIPKLPAPPPPVPKPAPIRKYRVVSGDSLWGIAHRNNISVSQLQHWNHLSARSTLHPGQILTLRGGSAPVSTRYTVRNGDSLWGIARRFGTHIETLKRLNNLGKKPVIRPGQVLLVNAHGPHTVYYEVRQGDSLWSIATRYRVQIAQIKAWNGLTGSRLIQPGQRLKILVDATG